MQHCFSSAGQLPPLPRISRLAVQVGIEELEAAPSRRAGGCFVTGLGGAPSRGAEGITLIDLVHPREDRFGRLTRPVWPSYRAAPRSTKLSQGRLVSPTAEPREARPPPQAKQMPLE